MRTSGTGEAAVGISAEDMVFVRFLFLGEEKKKGCEGRFCSFFCSSVRTDVQKKLAHRKRVRVRDQYDTTAPCLKGRREIDAQVKSGGLAVCQRLEIRQKERSSVRGQSSTG